MHTKRLTFRLAVFLLWQRKAKMSSTPSRQRIKFKDLAIGQRFYDPISAEYFIKQSDDMAAMVTGIGDGTIPDEFEKDDIVGIDI